MWLYKIHPFGLGIGYEVHALLYKRSETKCNGKLAETERFEHGTHQVKYVNLSTYNWLSNNATRIVIECNGEK